ncbi:MAG: hypothetical protein Q8N63_03520 [Nanoarchaeota archaeon]|nr:hypothetical protein [Nanoarchaeota archaeon]
MAHDNLYAIYLIVGILVGLGIIFGYIHNLPPIPPTPDNSPPFYISINPLSIPAGDYYNSAGYYNSNDQYTYLTFTLTPNKNRNITHLELSKNSVIVERENRTTQKVSSINWDNAYNSYNDYVFYFDSSTYYTSTLDTLTAKGHLNGCQNCFNDKDYPYFFTLNFIYAENNSAKKPYSVTIPFPIV